MRAPADWVLKTLQYIGMKGDFEESFIVMNQEHKS